MNESLKARLLRTAPPNLAGEIARVLRQSILSGEIGPGEKLPPEHAMASHFGVSRPVVREAVSQLRYEGLVRSLQGSGVYASESGVGTSYILDMSLLSDKKTLSEIFELRMMLEAEAASLAATRRTIDDLKAMQAALEGMARAIADGADGIAADIAFHQTIASATGNSQFQVLMKMLDQNIRGSISIARVNTATTEPEAIQAVQSEHKAIFSAISNSDPDGARQAALAHLQHTARQLRLS